MILSYCIAILKCHPSRRLTNNLNAQLQLHNSGSIGANSLMDTNLKVQSGQISNSVSITPAPPIPAQISCTTVEPVSLKVSKRSECLYFF